MQRCLRSHEVFVVLTRVRRSWKASRRREWRKLPTTLQMLLRVCPRCPQRSQQAMAQPLHTLPLQQQRRWNVRSQLSMSCTGHRNFWAHAESRRTSPAASASIAQGMVQQSAKRNTSEFIIGNVADTATLKAASKTRKTPLTDIDLMEKTPRARVALGMEVGSVYLRKFVETTAEGEVLAGYQNSRYRSKAQAAQKYWKLPQEGGEPLQWWPMSAVLGHVRMKRVDGLALCYERTNSDYSDLIDKYHKEMEQQGEQCFCLKCEPLPKLT